jgi:hypothetical protein
VVPDRRLPAPVERRALDERRPAFCSVFCKVISLFSGESADKVGGDTADASGEVASCGAVAVNEDEFFRIPKYFPFYQHACEIAFRIGRLIENLSAA